ncbi:hypothetical protein DAI22_05g074600 [Oryza sativa Japonica Group]|nr:hypothetical protein DAI22_05g074600 [Oryza sativa Japonica Group]
MVVVLLEARGKGGLVPWASLDSSVVTGVEKYDVDAAACSDFRVKLANIGGASLLFSSSRRSAWTPMPHRR